MTGGTAIISLDGYDIDTSKTNTDYRDVKNYSVENNSLLIDLGENGSLDIDILEDFPHVCQDVIDRIENNLPLIGKPRKSHFEACFGYIYAPNAGVNFIICEDSSQKVGDAHAREIFDISRFVSSPVMSFDKTER